MITTTATKNMNFQYSPVRIAILFSIFLRIGKKINILLHHIEFSFSPIYWLKIISHENCIFYSYSIERNHEFVYGCFQFNSIANNHNLLIFLFHFHLLPFFPLSLKFPKKYKSFNVDSDEIRTSQSINDLLFRNENMQSFSHFEFFQKINNNKMSIFYELLPDTKNDG